MGLRTAVSRALVLAVLALLVGAVCALLWANLSVLPAYEIQPDGHAEMAEPDVAQIFSASFWYSVLALFGGLALGIAAWVRLRIVGWPIALVSAALALIGGLTCWWLGEVIGPGPFEARLAAAGPGQEVAVALRLGTPSAIAIWVFAAVAVPLFAASLGPEVGRPADTRRGRSRRSAGPELVGVDAGADRANTDG